MLSSAGQARSIVFSLLFWRRIQAQICYLPDQTIEPSDNVCNASAPTSLCCQDGATCLTSGLCFSKWDTSINTGSCTDKTWTSTSCFQLCPPSPGIDHGFHTLYRCNDNQWCCSTGGNTTSCCNDGGVELFPLNANGAVMGGTGFLPNFTIAPVELLQTSMGAAPSSALLATPNTIDAGPTKSRSSAAAIITKTHYPERTSSASDATMTGLGAGLGVALLLLAGVTVALLFLRRLRSRSNSQTTKSEKKSNGQRKDIEQKPAGVVVVEDELSARYYGRQEMESLPAEMPNSRRENTQEMGIRE